MNRTKRISAFLLALVLVLALSACAGPAAVTTPGPDVQSPAAAAGEPSVSPETAPPESQPA